MDYNNTFRGNCLLTEGCSPCSISSFLFSTDILFLPLAVIPAVKSLICSLSNLYLFLAVVFGLMSCVKKREMFVSTVIIPDIKSVFLICL